MLSIRRIRPDRAELTPAEGPDPDWEVVHRARESCHLGGGNYEPSEYTVADERGRVIDRFRIDCDGQTIELTPAGEMLPDAE